MVPGKLQEIAMKKGEILSQHSELDHTYEGRLKSSRNCFITET